MVKLDNVAILNQPSEVKHPYASISVFLERKGQNSINTKENYERSIRDFFRSMRNKEIEQLTEEDLIFSKNQVERYQVALKKTGLADSTVNNAISALKSLYKKLKDDEFAVDPSWFDVERYKGYDSESWGVLTHNEVEQIYNYVLGKRKGEEKGLLIRLAYATGFRKESLLESTFSNNIIDRNGVKYMKVLGKGSKWAYNKLTPDLYETLMKHKEEVNRDKIFTLSDKTIKRMMKDIRENFDFGDRHIVFHSFRKASIQEVNQITGGDIKAMQAHANHSNSATTLNHYLASKSLDELVEVDINRELPTHKFNELSKEELVDLLMNIDRSTQIKLLLKLGAI